MLVGCCRCAAVAPANSPSHPPDLNKSDQNGYSPVFVAAAAGHLAVVKLLVECQVDIGRANIDGMTPVLIAAQNGRTEVVRLLIDAGANFSETLRGGEGSVYMSAERGHLEVVRLLADRKADIEKSNKYGATPVFKAALGGHASVVRLLAERGANLDTAMRGGWSALLMAVLNGNRAVAAELLARGADPNAAREEDGTTPLKCAHDRRDTELVALLLVHNADASGVFDPLLTACMRGNAKLARALLLGDDTLELARALIQEVRQASIPAAHAAVLRGDTTLETALAAADPGQADAAGLPALYYALELGHAALVPLLVKDGVATAAAEALATGDEGESTVPGACYARFVLALVSSGLTEAHEAKSLVSKYMGTVAATVHFIEAPAAFDALKAACAARLDAIAAPLEAIYTSEGLGEQLGGIGAESPDLPVRLDDPGLLPVPQGTDEYGACIVWAVSMALAAGYEAELRTALARFGTKVVITPAPVTDLLRLRKRASPMHNIDALQATVVVTDAAIIGEVFSTIGSEVGSWLRVENNYRPACESAWGYRALLGNFKYAVGVTFGRLFGKREWDTLHKSLPAGDREQLLRALQVMRAAPMADCPVSTVAQVEIVYKPYFDLDRAKSHLYHKVVRCDVAGELVRRSGSPLTRATKNAKAAAAKAAVAALLLPNGTIKPDRAPQWWEVLCLRREGS